MNNEPYLLRYSVMRPFCLVESRSQDAATNAGVLSVYLTTILHLHLEFCCKVL